MARILIAEDDPSFGSLLGDIVESANHEAVLVRNGAEALEALSKARFDLIISDQRMPLVDGLELLRRLPALGVTVPVIMLTAYGSIPDAVEAVRLGAAEYLTKPLPSPTTLLAVVNRLLAPEVSGDELVTVNPKVRSVLELVDRVALRDLPVLVTGESGTGKELIARRIHRHSARRDGPFVAVNCAALPESLAESELFGYEKGA
ncbi:MAG: sigma-54-dependent transcriptional regulator, partial [Thermoanaerobaculum sp.]